jgi:hypothetical protein
MGQIERMVICNVWRQQRVAKIYTEKKTLASIVYEVRGHRQDAVNPTFRPQPVHAPRHRLSYVRSLDRMSAAVLPSTGVSCAMQAKSKSTILNSQASRPETKESTSVVNVKVR